MLTFLIFLTVWQSNPESAMKRFPHHWETYGKNSFRPNRLQPMQHAWEAPVSAPVRINRIEPKSGEMFDMRTYAFLQFRVAYAFLKRIPMTDSIHAHRKNIYKGEAASHVDYITRHGRHKKRADLVATGQVNVPAKVSSFRELVAMGDAHERKRGIVAKEWVLSIPRPFGHVEAVELTRDWTQKLAQKKPAQWAVHDSPASDGGRNLHAHIVMLARVPDKIEREPEQIFTRHSPTDPASGGWKKEREASSREGFSIKLRGDRLMCAAVANAHLSGHGHEQRVDARSFAERGILRAPGKHLYPSGMRTTKAANA